MKQIKWRAIFSFFKDVFIFLIIAGLWLIIIITTHKITNDASLSIMIPIGLTLFYFAKYYKNK